MMEDESEDKILDLSKIHFHLIYIKICMITPYSFES
jgi:hypothetical protein